MAAQLHCEHAATPRNPSSKPPSTGTCASTLSHPVAASKGMMPRRRTYSHASMSSAASDANKPASEDQFVFSPQQSPRQGPSSSLTRAPATDQHTNAGTSSSPQNHCQHPLNASKPSIAATTNISTVSNDSPTPHSRPIAIELPPSVTRKINSSSVYTPIEPLSGRGDIIGGYFPFHEDPNKRVHRPHPFHTDKEGSKIQIPFAEPQDDTVGASSLHLPHRPPTTKPSASAPKSFSVPKMSREQTPTPSRSHTPVTSYVPSGLHDAQLPLGKYYPSNYEAMQRRSNQATPTPSRPSSATGPSSIKSDTAVPQITRTDSSHSRSDSDARRRLQQYQRDMVAQATQAARQIASGKGSSAHLAAAHGISVQKFQIGSHRPISPRLEPLGSPGPVTPMELEGDGGYLTRGRPVPSPDAGREDDAIAKAMAAEAARVRREGRSSPAVEAGGFGF